MRERRLESISPTTMSSLAESDLLDLMDQVPLDELYKTDRECPRWRSIKPIALARRRSVTLVVGNYTPRPLEQLIKVSYFNIPYLAELNLPASTYPITPEMDFLNVHHSILLLDSVNQEEAARLATSFPLVRDLRVVIGTSHTEETPFSRVTFLLTQWKATLAILKIWYGGNEPQDLSFLGALNSLAAVNHLTLENPMLQLAPNSDYFKKMADNLFLPAQQQEQVIFPQVDLHVLSHLKELNLATLDHPNCLVDSLKRYPNGCDIRLAMATEISRHHIPDSYESVPQVVVSRIRSITKSNTYDLIEVDQMFGSVCARFNGLTSLSIRIKYDMSIVELMDQMVPLAKSLIYLHVTFHKKEATYQEVGLVHVSQGPLIPLPSVQILSLSSETITYRHTDLSPLRISEAFPNLVVIKVKDSWLYGFRCENNCQSLFKPEPAKCCIRRQLLSLIQCISLQTIFIGYNDDRYKRGELFPEPLAQDGANMVGLNIANMPYEFVLAVFARLPLSELFIVNQVSANWNKLRDHHLPRRTDVCLIVEPFQRPLEPVLSSRFNHNLAKIRHNSLTSRWLTQADTSRFVSTFPNLTTLRLFHVWLGHEDEQMEMVHDILDNLSQSLTKLSIYFQNDDRDSDEFEYPLGLLSTINSMPKLKHLCLEFPNAKLLDDEEDQVLAPNTRFDLQVLARLTRFRFMSRDHPSMLMHSLQNYAETNNTLTQVHLLVLSADEENWFQSQQYRGLSRALRGKIQFGRFY